jgi:hypothetical protein
MSNKLLHVRGVMYGFRRTTESWVLDVGGGDRKMVDMQVVVPQHAEKTVPFI